MLKLIYFQLQSSRLPSGEDGRGIQLLTDSDKNIFQDGAPVTSPTLVTRLVQPIYDLVSVRISQSRQSPILIL